MPISTSDRANDTIPPRRAINPESTGTRPGSAQPSRVFISRLTVDHPRSRRSISRPARAVGAPPAQDALVLLGPDHPLARTEVRMEGLWRQVMAVGVLLQPSGGGNQGAAVLPAVIAAAVVGRRCSHVSRSSRETGVAPRVI